eukprot:CAMPEP_0183378566 /NCGR_PEP_ID=MMETSP0164_2-20130417/124980_1 /TAXON_ID=221442 /ORGANISM="Coccolithus pelagicus ssp braarudi, Strain PLY182g" /LENGTH=388 /DNA_ID=CAMNT_0025556135 /DNA_START=210 /DNA_END=1376 /DNA_ORIENTATION=-
MADLLRLFGRQPRLVSCTGKLIKYQKQLRPHSAAIATHADALAPHLPRILDSMDVLEPYLSALFDDALPQLLPYMGALLDELDVLAPLLPAITSHRADLLPVLPYIAPRLPSLRMFIGTLSSRLDALAPFLPRIAPHLDALLPHMPLIVEHIDVLIPHLQVLTQEEALIALLPYADLLLRSHVGLLQTQAQKLADPTSGGVSGPRGSALLQELLQQAHAVHEGADANGVDETEKHTPVASSERGSFWEGWRKLFGGGEKLDVLASESDRNQGGRELISEVEMKLDGSETRLKLIERQFVEFKEMMHFRAGVGQADALKLAAAEGSLIEVEDGILVLMGSVKDLREGVIAHVSKVGVEAINRGKERQLVTRRDLDEQAKSDSFLWKLPL